MKTITKEEYKNLPLEYKQLAQNLYIDLSPENLSCDGELPAPIVKKRYNEICKKLKELENKVNRNIPEGIVWSEVQ